MIYLLIALLIIAINVVPAFMPATWIVLAFFYLKYDLPLIPTVILGASCATIGRVLLWHIAKYFLHSILPKKIRDNYKALGMFLNKHKHISLPLIISYAFLPIPSNQVYIAAGLAHFDVKLLAASFFIGRLISYSFWLSVAYQISSRIDYKLHHSYDSPETLYLEFISLILLFTISVVPWKRLLKRWLV